jgi:nicotinate phosphoribosyltransferase
MISPPDDLALLTDLYELTMVQAYWVEGMHDTATFSLFSRRLPEHRNFLLAAGLNEALALVEHLEFSADAIEYLQSQDVFQPEFLKWLSDWKFRGDIWALPEGTPFFENEPLLEVSAPLPEAQLLESLLMNQVHLPTLLASKAARVALAAGERTVIDFGLRRMHGIDASLKAARAFYLAGIDATSNVLAGRRYGVPVAGTMAHSYIEAHERELDAFRNFAAVYENPVLLIDTYDVAEGTRNVIRLAQELHSPARIRGVRIDSGDLGALARMVRGMLDQAGLNEVQIFVSGGLDEQQIEKLVEESFPIDGFGVGTSMGVSEDAPALDIAYKLAAYAGTGRLKLSSGKATLPCRKQIFRSFTPRGRATGDVIAKFEEKCSGERLLQLVMQAGKRIGPGLEPLEASRKRAQQSIAQLPSEVRALTAAEPPYPVKVSKSLSEARQSVIERLKQLETKH